MQYWTISHILTESPINNKAKDGALYITGTGNTRNKNGILKEARFKEKSILTVQLMDEQHIFGMVSIK